jgi:hypothetical protein
MAGSSCTKLVEKFQVMFVLALTFALIGWLSDGSTYRRTDANWMQAK